MRPVLAPRTLAFATLALLLPGAALAHPGHAAAGFGAGFAHPFGGADHLLAMLALGLLAAQMPGRGALLLPAVFVASMLAGAAGGSAGLAFAGTEPVILASVIVLGALVAGAARLPLGHMAVMAAVFGLAHGWAHGAEGPGAGEGMAAYALGFALATAFLHGAGIAAGRVATGALLRAAGGGTALAGLALVMAA